MHRLLVVDDGPSICFAMSEYFMTQGYEVDCARKVEEAEGLLSSNVCYSAVIADLRLTGIYNMDGLDVVKFTRERCPEYTDRCANSLWRSRGGNRSAEARRACVSA